MDEQYDIIILGTGVTECILSGIFSSEGKKVLHVDRNNYYGGETAPLKLSELYGKFNPDKLEASDITQDKDYKVNLVPKFMMANGEIVQFLIHTDVTRYLEFKSVAGNFVAHNEDETLKFHKLPASASEIPAAIALLGAVESRRLHQFFEFIQGWKTQGETKAEYEGFDFNAKSIADLYDKFALEPRTRDLIGYSMAMYLDDSYLTKPAYETAERIVLYSESTARYGKSPFIYPIYGVGDIPQSFSRLSAVHGGTFMLERAVNEIVYENGVAVGIRSGDEVAKAKQIICDPSYCKEKTKSSEKVVRAICLLKHAIPGTSDADSAQIILLQNDLGRKHPIYVSVVSNTHAVCPKDMYIATVSTIVETDEPENELKAGLDLLGTIHEKFVYVSDINEPTGDGKDDQVFISRSYDASSHFESVCEDVKSIYHRMTGTDLKLKQRDPVEEEG